MDSTAGSGHRPTVAVGAPIFSSENRAVQVVSGHTRPEADYLTLPGNDRLWCLSRPSAADSTSTTLAIDGLTSLSLDRNRSCGIPITRKDDQASVAGYRTVRQGSSAIATIQSQPPQLAMTTTSIQADIPDRLVQQAAILIRDGWATDLDEILTDALRRYLSSHSAELNEAFIHRVTHQQPFGILKYAMTLDGKIATVTGDSFWITSPGARQVVHKLRSRCDAVITGGNTVRHDNPSLTTHGLGHNPLRVVMSRSLNLPADCKLWTTEDAPTIVFTLPQENSTLKDKLLQLEVEVIEMAEITPAVVMAELTRRGCNQVLWECGGNLAAQAIAAGVIAKLYTFIAPKIIGGSGLNPIADLGITSMSAAKKLTTINIQQIGDDFLIIGYL